MQNQESAALFNSTREPAHSSFVHVCPPLSGMLDVFLHLTFKQLNMVLRLLLGFSPFPLRADLYKTQTYLSFLVHAMPHVRKAPPPFFKLNSVRVH